MKGVSQKGPKLNVPLITAEFNSVTEVMENCKNGVLFFGSARIPEDNSYFMEAESLASKLVQAGYEIITGGGPGIMAAGNKGAILSEGKSFSICMDFKDEPSNPYVDRKNKYTCSYFFTRKYGLYSNAKAIVCFPGGLGTLDELFEVLVLRQMKKLSWYPIFLFGTDYWQGLWNWLHSVPLDWHMISQENFGQFFLTDSSDEILQLMLKTYQK